jgi:uncharacterized damage-inducible protein DinB
VKDLLTSYLGAQRRHVLGILEGLDDAGLRRPVLPSGWSCLGLVQHLAVDVERFWFGAVVGGDADVIAGLAPNDAWTVGPDVPAAEVLELYRREIALADAVIAAASLDDAPAWWPAELFGDWRLDNVADALLHVITETASHTGHLDAARELIDGRQWMVLE